MIQSSSYYVAQLTSLYKSASPKAIAWLTQLISYFDNIETCRQQINAAFDLDTAVGEQLDILGTMLATPRTVKFQPTGGVSPTLDDATYRVLLKARIILFNWNGQVEGLTAAWKLLFPGGSIVVTDNQNMTMNVLCIGPLTSIVKDLITHDYIVPRPQAVGINYFFPALPMFGFGRNDAYIAGFNLGKWV